MYIYNLILMRLVKSKNDGKEQDVSGLKAAQINLSTPRHRFSLVAIHSTKQSGPLRRHCSATDHLYPPKSRDSNTKRYNNIFQTVI